MQTVKRPVRRYSEPDPDMLQSMRTRQVTFETEDKDLFADLNPTFGGTFGADWLTAIKAGELVVPNAARVGELREDTADVEAALEAGRVIARRVLYFAGEAFPGNVGRLDQFGKHLYDKVREDAAAFQVLLEMQLAQLTTGGDLAALIAQGFPAGTSPTDPAGGLNQLKAALALLRTRETAQQVQKGGNKEATSAGIRTLNACFEPARQLARAAAFVAWPAEVRAAKLAFYRLPDVAPEDHEYTLAPGEEGTRLFEDALSPGRRLSVSGLPAETSVEVGLSLAVGAAPGQWIKVPAGTPHHPTRLTIGAELPVLDGATCVVARNPGQKHLHFSISLLDSLPATS